jgi:hypothetical protein
MSRNAAQPGVVRPRRHEVTTMYPAGSYRAVGVTLLILGAGVFALGFFGDRSVLRILGPTLAFFGGVLLARAKRRS